MARFRLAEYFLAVALVVFLGGCAPSAANRQSTSESGADKGAQANGQSAQNRSGQSSGDTKESSVSSGGSLQQMREGQSTKTPPSSPLGDIYFDFDRSDLRADARDALRKNADWLKNNPSVRVEIEGHCDDRGTNEYNLALGAKRAQAARDYLATLGIVGDRMSTISYGEEIPVCRDAGESCWRQNRRARFVIVPGRGAN